MGIPLLLLLLLQVEVVVAGDSEGGRSAVVCVCV